MQLNSIIQGKYYTFKSKIIETFLKSLKSNEELISLISKYLTTEIDKINIVLVHLKFILSKKESKLINIFRSDEKDFEKAILKPFFRGKLFFF
jgi:hypothetical protein